MKMWSEGAIGVYISCRELSFIYFSLKKNVKQKTLFNKNLVDVEGVMGSCLHIGVPSTT